MKPVVAPAIAAVRRETTSAEEELSSVVGSDELACKTLIVKKGGFLRNQYGKRTAVDASDDLVGETVDSRSGAEVEVIGVFELLERVEEVEVIEVIGVGVDRDDVDDDADVGVVGIAVVTGSRDVDADVVLIFMVKNV